MYFSDLGMITSVWPLTLSILITAYVISVASLPEVIRIGGLFEKTEHHQEDFAFRFAINNINADLSILPKSSLSAKVAIIPPQDSFHAYRSACEFLESGVVAIVGPASSASLGILKSTCDFFHIPVIQTHWGYRTKANNFSLNLYPHPSVLATAYLDLIIQNQWKSLTILYEDSDALIRLQELIKFQRKTESGLKIRLRFVYQQEDLKKMMKDLGMRRENNFVVDLPLPRVRQLFQDAKEAQMMTVYQNYLLTTLDIHTEKWISRFESSSNITALRLIKPDIQTVRRVVDGWIVAEQTHGKDVKSQQPIRTEAALVYDAVNLVAKSLESLDNGQRIQIRSLFCDGPERWYFGSTLLERMKKFLMTGLSGEIRIDENGERTDFNLDIVKVRKEGIQKIGTWDPKKRAETLEDLTISTRDLFKNKILRVTTVITAPYMMNKEPSKNFTGNDRFEGYCADLLEKIRKELEFNYVIKVVEDKKHGAKQPTGEWNGMVGELMRREADLAIGDLSITYDRKQVVDFTMPFMNLGISILFRKHESKLPSLLAFMDPLSLEVWIYMVTAFLGISLLMFMIARLSPYEWREPQLASPDNEVQNQFSLLNIFWFVMGSIMQQGSDILPRAISTRIVASSWWFFTLIMIKTYTANLAAFLTSLRMVSPITNVNDLAKQTKIQYGSVDSGSTQNFFRDAKYSTYQRMWAYMETQSPSVFTKDNDEGIQRVLMGNYAFLMESTSIDYVTARNCELTKIGQQLDSKGYGIATQLGSPYRNNISSVILKLQEDGELHMLKEKWWKGITCPPDLQPSAEMNMGNVRGVFLVLWIGIGIGLVIVIIEFIWNAKKQLNREPILRMLWKELKFILSFNGSSRPVPKDDDEPLVGNTGTLPVSGNA